MMEYREYACCACRERLVICHQYIGDERCEGCGQWQSERVPKAPPPEGPESPL